jgi:hypothetical protein
MILNRIRLIPNPTQRTTWLNNCYVTLNFSSNQFVVDG